MLGIMPGYPNSATGVVATAIPAEHLYAQYGVYDGNRGRGPQRRPGGRRISMATTCTCSKRARIGKSAREQKPGQAAASGYWRQTGLLWPHPAASYAAPKASMCLATSRSLLRAGRREQQRAGGVGANSPRPIRRSSTRTVISAWGSPTSARCEAATMTRPALAWRTAR